MKSIIISGATGMIGCSIARVAAESGYSVTCIVRKSSERVKNLPESSNITIVQCDLSEYKALQLGEKHDAFIHLAWDKTFGESRDNVDIQERNVQYTLDAVRLAHRAGCSVFVGAGSQAEYGLVTVPLAPGLPVDPQSGYGIAKYAAGKLSGILCEQLGMRQNWIRIVSTYGIQDAPYTLISYVIEQISAGRSPELTKCEQIWDYLFCDDAARAFLAVAMKGKNGRAYPLGSGKGKRLSSYIEEIRSQINPGVELSYGAKEYYPHQPMHLVADISQLTVDTGWEPRVSFSEGISRVIVSKSSR